jgi:hypothetical protein
VQLGEPSRGSCTFVNVHTLTRPQTGVQLAFFFCRHSKCSHLFKLSSGCKMEEDPLIHGRYLVSEMLQELREDFVPSSNSALMRATFSSASLPRKGATKAGLAPMEIPPTLQDGIVFIGWMCKAQISSVKSRSTVTEVGMQLL